MPHPTLVSRRSLTGGPCFSPPHFAMSAPFPFEAPEVTCRAKFSVVVVAPVEEGRGFVSTMVVGGSGRGVELQKCVTRSSDGAYSTASCVCFHIHRNHPPSLFCFLGLVSTLAEASSFRLLGMNTASLSALEEGYWALKA